MFSKNIIRMIDEQLECPTCGSAIVDGKCSDVGDNNCQYIED